MSTYIDRLSNEGKERKLIKAFENELLNVKVFYSRENPFCGKLTLRKEYNDGAVARVYHLTDYTCDLTNHSANFDERSIRAFSDEKVKRIYISFMNRTFSDYKQNYLNVTNAQARKDLGEIL